MANLAFSLTAAAGTLAVTILSAYKGAWAVALVWGLLFVGFILRARRALLPERRRRRR